MSAVVDVAAVASVVLAVAVIVDMALAVAAVLAMAMEATKVCFLFDCSVLFSTFLTPLFPPYPTPMQQKRKLWADALRLQHGSVGDSSALWPRVWVYIGAVVTAVAADKVVAVVAVIMAVAMAVVAAVAKAEDIAYVA